MATAQTPPGSGAPVDVPPEDVAPRRSDRSPWNWLLVIPVLVPLLVPLYNAVDPRWGGWPRFYWLQMLFVVLGVGTTSLVYRMTRRSAVERRAAQDAIARDAAQTEER
jgi:Protein of unknown function (DUF3311)